MVVSTSDYQIGGMACATPAELADALSIRPLLAARHIARGRVEGWLEEYGFSATAAAVRDARAGLDDPFMVVVEVDLALRGEGERRWTGRPLTRAGLTALHHDAQGDEALVAAVDLLTPELLALIAAHASDRQLQQVAEEWAAADEQFDGLCRRLPSEVVDAHVLGPADAGRRLHLAILDPATAVELQTLAAAVPRVARHANWFAQLRSHDSPAAWLLQTLVADPAVAQGRPLAATARANWRNLAGRLVSTVGVVALVSTLWVVQARPEGEAATPRPTAVAATATRPAAPPPTPRLAPPPPAPVTASLPDDCAVAAFATHPIRVVALEDRSELSNATDIPARAVESRLVRGWDPGQFVVVAGYETDEQASQAVETARAQGFDGVPVQGSQELCRELA